MRVRTLIAVTIAAGLIVALIGCGASTQQARNSRGSYGDDSKPRISGSSRTSTARAADRATASEVQYYGWKALKLTNGLVTVIAVPAIGGRVMEYNLGEHRFLWVNKDELSGGEEAETQDGEGPWVNYGGYKVWPAPQSQWGGPPDPKGSDLDGGTWTGKIVEASGSTASIELTSPEDASVTGLQMTRRLTLLAGTTHLKVVETFRNVSKRDVSWAIWGVTQVPGSLRPGEKASAEAKIFFPLSANSRHSNGFVYIAEDTASQWTKVANGKILQTSYAGAVGKIGADSDAGWIAYVDDIHDLALVQTFSVNTDGTYPDNQSVVQVYTSPAELGYMEVEVNSPITKIPPGESFSFTQDWYCTSVGGPVVKVTDAGAINTHPSAARKGKNLVVTGKVGVFAPGELTLVFLDKDGKKIDASPPVKVGPTSKSAVNIRAKLPEGATSSMLVLNDTKGRKIGNIAEIPVTAGLAKAPKTPSPGS